GVKASGGWVDRPEIWIYILLDPLVAAGGGGTVMPGAFAVLRLIMSLFFVGVCAGRSAGFLPLKIRSTYPAPRGLHRRPPLAFWHQKLTDHRCDWALPLAI